MAYTKHSDTKVVVFQRSVKKGGKWNLLLTSGDVADVPAAELKSVAAVGTVEDLTWWFPGGSAFRNVSAAISSHKILDLLVQEGFVLGTSTSFQTRQVDEEGAGEQKEDHMEAFVRVTHQQFDQLGARFGTLATR
jgi:hypothetical protein